MLSWFFSIKYSSCEVKRRDKRVIIHNGAAYSQRHTWVNTYTHAHTHTESRWYYPNICGFINTCRHVKFFMPRAAALRSAMCGWENLFISLRVRTRRGNHRPADAHPSVKRDCQSPATALSAPTSSSETAAWLRCNYSESSQPISTWLRPQSREKSYPWMACLKVGAPSLRRTLQCIVKPLLIKRWLALPLQEDEIREALHEREDWGRFDCSGTHWSAGGGSIQILLFI